MEFIEIYKKPVIEKFVKILGEEYLLSDIFISLEEIKGTNENDKWGDYSLRDYELTNPDIMDLLVKLDLVKNYRGERMANLYCVKNKEKLKEFENDLLKLDNELEESENKGIL